MTRSDLPRLPSSSSQHRRRRPRPRQSPLPSLPLLSLLSLLLLFTITTPPTATAHEVDYYLQLDVQPASSTGGVAFPNQPVVSARQLTGFFAGELDLNTTGLEVVAVIEDIGLKSANRFAVLRGGDNGTTAVLDEGFARFDSLHINEADNYTIKFYVDGQTSVTSDRVHISVGPPDHIHISTQPGTALGGEALSPQPAVSIHDAGDNVVTDEDVTVSVNLTAVPDGSSGVLTGPALTVMSVNGTATFSGLTIDKAGWPYRMSFWTDFDYNTPVLESENFTVAVGPSVDIQVLQQPDGARGGLAFDTQPIVALVDAGGNINVADNFSTITVELGVNPDAPDGTLYPTYERFELPGTLATVTTGSEYIDLTTNASEWLLHGDKIELGTVHEPVLVEERTYSEVVVRLVRDPYRVRLQVPWAGANMTSVTVTRVRSALSLPVVAGVATFSDLHIDRRGLDYTLVFTSSLVANGTLFKETGKVGHGYGYGRSDGKPISTVSNGFNVTLGVPSWLRIEAPVADAWAGGQPFGQQPSVSVLDNGGNIMDGPEWAGYNMSVVLKDNPSNSTLLGFRHTIDIVKGVADFLDLGVKDKGVGYSLEFSTDMHSNVLPHEFDVTFSTEYMVVNHDAYPRDFLGASVDILEDYAVVGAPLENNEVREVQVITTSAERTTYINEIQIVTLESDHVPDIQRVSIVADADTDVSGHFTLSWDGNGPSRLLTADIHEDYVKVTVEADLGSGTGEVTVTRGTDCTNDTLPVPSSTGDVCVYTYDIRFDDLFGEVPLVTADGSALVGTSTLSGNVTAGSVRIFTERVQTSTLITGDFTLSIVNHTTAPIPSDATAANVSTALEALDIGQVNVTRTGPDAVDGYVWSVTFTATSRNYDVPLMTADTSGLAGVNERVTVHTHTQGQAPIGGTFQLWFRGHGPSEAIAWDETEYFMQQKLKSLVTIDVTEVTRSGPNLDNGYSWTVTFVDTRTPTEEGQRMNGKHYEKAFLLDDPFDENLPPLIHSPPESAAPAYVWKTLSDPAVDGELTGTGAAVTVSFVYGNPESPPWSAALRGSDGEAAGAAYVYTRDGEGWVEVQKLRGRDTDDYDHFGHAVAIGGNHTTHSSPELPMTVAVAAPYAADNGVTELQALHCTADGGTFRLAFKGVRSPRLDWDATADDVEAALVGTGGLTGVEAVILDGGATICSASSATTEIRLTFPEDGDQPTLIVTNDPPDESLSITHVLEDTDSLSLAGVLEDAVATVEVLVNGTTKASGFNSTMANVGAVYIFEYIEVDAAFLEVQKLMAGSVPGDRKIGDGFGTSIAMDNYTLVVGAPGSDGNVVGSTDVVSDAGAVYVYTYDTSISLWKQVQRVVYDLPQAEDRFGQVLAFDGSTLAVQALRGDDHQGTVYVFRKDPREEPDTRLFNLDQILTHPTQSGAAVAPTPWLEFGYSLAVVDDSLLVGAPGTRTTRDGFVTSATGAPTGAVFAYDRLNEFHHFELRQELVPTTALAYERVGRAVAVVGDTVVTCSLANFTGQTSALTPVHEVQLIRSTATSGATLGNRFTLGWKRRFVAAARGLAERGTGLGVREPAGQWVQVTSDPIRHDVDEPTLRTILQDQLATGRVNVERFGPNQEGGYRWYVTFSGQAEAADLPLLHADASELTGAGAAVTVTRVSRAMDPHRGLCTTWTRDPTAVVGTAAAVWTEQAVLSPHRHQGGDLFGWSIAMDRNTALIGAPNRDYFPTGINPGAGFFFDMGFLNVRFVARDFDVDENGVSINITVALCDPACHVPPNPAMNEFTAPEQRVWVRTSDGEDWGVYDVHDVAFPGTGHLKNQLAAVGRTDCHAQSIGAPDCEWVGGASDKFKLSAYDFRAVNDYAPILHELVFDDTSAGPESVEMELVITDDQILETDETLHLHLFSPGVEPSFGGDLWTDVTILDDGDGGVGDRGYVDRLLFDNVTEAGFKFGEALALGLGGTVAIVGAPGADVDGVGVGVGSVKAFFNDMGMWDEEASLDLPASSAVDFARFGAGLALERDTASTAVIAAPGAVTVSFFTRNESEASLWRHSGTLTPDHSPGQAVLPEHMFGGRHAVAVSGSVAAVGCRGLEAVFIFRDASGTGDAWAQTTIIRSSDYRDFVWLDVLHLFRAHFGASVALHWNTLLVGSPRANYGNISEPTHFNDVLAIEPFIRYEGTGALYIYELNTTGRGDDGKYPYAVEDADGGFWVEHDTLLAPDRKKADRFGEAVAIHRDQLIVGAPNTPAAPETTWDFETGDLRGWTATGTAFQHQPTYGDNPAYRNVYSSFFGPSSPQTSAHRGRYWIGTYERRPANGTDYTAEPSTAAGTVQGDAPQGTLTSHPFVIAGGRISLLVGGGCNERLEYVELLVDGDSTLRATGACAETMARVHWNVSLHQGRTGQIRVVDASSAGWAHINVDDIRFDWAMQEYEESTGAGAAYLWRRKAAGADTEEPCIAHPMQPAELDPVSFQPLECDYQYQQRLVPSDKRLGISFGHDVAVDDVTGTALVSALLQSVTRPDWDLPGSYANVQLGAFGSMRSMRADGGINNLDVGGLEYSVWADGTGAHVNPFLTNVGSSRGGVANTGQQGWDMAGDGMLFGGSGPAGTSGLRFSARGGTSGVNTNAPFDTGNPFYTDVLPTNRGTQARGGGIRPTNQVAFGGRRSDNLELGANPAPTGTVYVFDRRTKHVRNDPRNEFRDGKFRLQDPPFWPVQQHSQLHVASMGPGFRLGSALAINDYTALLGAPGDSTVLSEAGSALAVDLEYQRLKFAETQYPIMENFHLRRVTVLVLREGDITGSLTVHYSTRDVTAFGVNATYHAECLTMPQFDRSPNGCGDYSQKSGELYFGPYDYSNEITVDIIDDDCHEEHSEWFAIQLSVPGGVAVLGEGLSTLVRIDDDDLGKGTDTCLQPR